MNSRGVSFALLALWLTAFGVWFMHKREEDPLEDEPIEHDPTGAPAYMSPDEWFEDMARRGEGQ